MAKEKKTINIPRLTEDEMRDFVHGVVDGTIFTSAQVKKPDDIGIVFMPLMMGALTGYTKREILKIGVFYEYIKESLPRSINGMPCFPSCQMIGNADWKRALVAIQTEQARRKIIAV